MIRKVYICNKYTKSSKKGKVKIFTSIYMRGNEVSVARSKDGFTVSVLYVSRNIIVYHFSTVNVASMYDI